MAPVGAGRAAEIYAAGDKQSNSATTPHLVAVFGVVSTAAEAILHLELMTVTKRATATSHAKSCQVQQDLVPDLPRSQACSCMTRFYLDPPRCSCNWNAHTCPGKNIAHNKKCIFAMMYHTGWDVF